MFRRIEFIHPGFEEDDDGEAIPPWKGGLMSVVTGPVAESWSDDLAGPARLRFPTNARFYFTEKGWIEVGRKVVAAARQTGLDYRIVAIKETDAQVLWRDKARGYEVAVQPKRKPRTVRDLPSVE